MKALRIGLLFLLMSMKIYVSDDNKLSEIITWAALLDSSRDYKDFNKRINPEKINNYTYACYKLLNLNMESIPTEAEITKNYRKLAFQYHPDKSQSFKEIIAAINQAKDYFVMCFGLTSEKLRLAYLGKDATGINNLKTPSAQALKEALDKFYANNPLPKQQSVPKNETQASGVTKKYTEKEKKAEEWFKRYKDDMKTLVLNKPLWFKQNTFTTAAALDFFLSHHLYFSVDYGAKQQGIDKDHLLKLVNDLIKEQLSQQINEDAAQQEEIKRQKEVDERLARERKLQEQQADFIFNESAERERFEKAEATTLEKLQNQQREGLRQAFDKENRRKEVERLANERKLQKQQSDFVVGENLERASFEKLEAAALEDLKNQERMGLRETVDKESRRKEQEERLRRAMDPKNKGVLIQALELANLLSF